MAEEEGKAPIIIKRIKKGGHAAHGGAWKVAYADFVTAMMAFFLLLWLLNSVTEEQLQGISNYFAPTAVSQSPSGAGGILGGQVIGEGASQSRSSSPATSMNLPPTTVGSGGSDFTDPKEGQSDKKQDASADFNDAENAQSVSAKVQEEEQAKKLEAELKQALQALPELKALQNSLQVDTTPEGVRIQIIDQDQIPMFPAGSSAMYERTKQLLLLVSKVIKLLPQQIAIAGHTDAMSFSDPTGYGNWELSADRALAARRVLLTGGVADQRINRVSGRASAEPMPKENPDSPRNRRISIILLRDTPVPPGGPDPRAPIPSILKTN